MNYYSTHVPDKKTEAQQSMKNAYKLILKRDKFPDRKMKKEH